MISKSLIISFSISILFNAILSKDKATPVSSPIAQFDINLDEPYLQRHSEVAKQLCPPMLKFLYNLENQVSAKLPGGHITLSLINLVLGGLSYFAHNEVQEHVEMIRKHCEYNKRGLIYYFQIMYD